MMLLLDIRGVRIATMAVFGITRLYLIGNNILTCPYRHYARFYPRIDH